MSKLANKILQYHAKGLNSFREAKIRALKILKNDKGFGLIETIIVVAIIILGILAIRPNIISIFTDTVSAFGTWIAQKRGELFN